jgi:hypothetical protein
VSSFDESDNGSHEPPPGAGPGWQETVLLAWFDPVARAGGFHHVDLQHVAGRACLQSWLALEGEVVARRQDLELALPQSDVGALEVPTLRLTTRAPLRDYGFAIELDGVGADLEYAALVDPYSYEVSSEGAAIASGHYESFGRVTGTLRAGAREVAVCGSGFQDHSWGERDYGAFKAHRWACAMFGEDLFACLYSVTVDRGRRDFGYVCERGAFHPVVRTAFNVRMDDDGHSPLGADVHVWTGDGRGYRMQATVDASSPSTQHGGYFVSDGLARWECGGRLGAGLLEVNELAAPLPAQRAALGLEP